MTTASRPSRFHNYSMGNGNDKQSQALGSTLPNQRWQPSIWSDQSIGSFGKRDTGGPKAPSNDDTFSSGASGFSTLGGPSDSDPWASRPGAWNNTESPRNTSGNTSPNRTRDGAIHDLSTTSPYYTSPQSHMQPAIGQRASIPNRAKPGSTLDSSAQTFQYGQFSDYNDEKEDSRSFGPGFRPDKRGSQDSSFLNVVGAPSRDPNMPPSGRSDPDQSTQGNVYGDFAYAKPAANAAHSKRPSIAGIPGPFLAQPTNSRSFIDDEELQHKFTSNMSLNDGSNMPQNGLGNNPSYGNGTSQPFRLNPVSQPWDHGKGHGNGTMQLQDSYVDPLAGPYANKRGGPMGRESPAGSAYRSGGIGSPSTYGGTPQPGADPWSRPASRDPRWGPDMDRRSQGQHFFQHQQQQQQQQVPQYYLQQAYNFNAPTQFAPHAYNPYSPAPPNFRPTIPVPNYALPMSGYLGAGGLYLRPNRDSDSAKGIRSPLLEEFRSSSKSNKRYDLKDIYDHIVEFSGDQQGSRFIQQKLETANSDEKDRVFREIEPNAIQLMKDVFGNYVIQKFFEHGSQVQKKVLAGIMKGKFADLSVQMYACRVVQKVLEHALVEQQAELVKELEPDVLRVIKDQHGNHVIQKIIQLVPRQYIDFIMDCLRGRVSELSTHPYGCRVIQRVLEHGTDADKATVMQEIHSCAQTLITDQYGNYVAQHVIEHGKPEDRSKMIRVVISQFVKLSKHKFASNVVEKCIEFGSRDELEAIQKELTAVGGDAAANPLQLMMKDQYGNYVIQKLLNQLEGADRAAFIEEMKPQLTSLKKVSTGRQIAAIDRLISVVSSSTTTMDPTPASTEPASPTLQADASSPGPTPNLTMEPNSPSSSPPSTNASAVGEAVNEGSKTEAAPQDEVAAACPEVRINEA